MADLNSIIVSADHLAQFQNASRVIGSETPLYIVKLLVSDILYEYAVLVVRAKSNADKVPHYQLISDISE